MINCKEYFFNSTDENNETDTCDTSQTIEEFLYLPPEAYVNCLEYVYLMGHIYYVYVSLVVNGY